MLTTLENEQGCRSKDLEEHLLQKLGHQQGAESYQNLGNSYRDVIFLLENLLMNFRLLFPNLLFPASHLTFSCNFLQNCVMNSITEVTQVLQSLLLLSNSITLIGENSAFCSGRLMAQKTIQPLPPCPPKIKLNQINSTFQLGIYYLEVTSFPQNSSQGENSPIAEIRVQYQVLVKQPCETTAFFITVPVIFWFSYLFMSVEIKIKDMV